LDERSGIGRHRARARVAATGAPDSFGTVQGPVVPAAITFDGAFLYFVGSGDAAGVYRMARGGGNVETILTANGAAFTDIVVVGSTLYIADARDTPAGSVLALSTAGGQPTTLAASQARPTRLAHSATALYWTNDVDDGDVMAIPLTGGTPISIASHLDHPRAIVVDDAVYFTTNDAVLKRPL
jgi:hypothetical protein